MGPVRVAVVLLSAWMALPAAAAAPGSLRAPVWHVGDWWRVRSAALSVFTGAGPMPAGGRRVQDSPTAAQVYRFVVAGQETLVYEQQQGTRHIGQRVPPERCWVVRVSREAPSAARPGGYLLYYRVEDLSLRQILLVPADPKRRGLFCLYSGTALNDDDPAHPRAARIRGPFIDGSLPVVLQWPSFGAPAARQTAEPSAQRTRVMLEDGPRPIVQEWAPGYPWWVASDRRGLERSQLIETNKGPVR